MFRRRRFFTGDHDENGVPDVAWLRTDGQEMGGEDWSEGTVWSMAVYLNGEAITEPGTRGEEIAGESFLLLLNSGLEPVDVALPGGAFGESWIPVLDTSDDSVGTEPEPKPLQAGTTRTLVGHCLVLLRRG